MPWVRFLQRFDYVIRPTLVRCYRAGSVHLVKQDCAERAIKAGKAVAAERPDKRRPHAGR